MPLDSSDPFSAAFSDAPPAAAPQADAFSAAFSAPQQAAGQSGIPPGSIVTYNPGDGKGARTGTVAATGKTGGAVLDTGEIVGPALITDIKPPKPVMPSTVPAMPSMDPTGGMPAGMGVTPADLASLGSGFKQGVMDVTGSLAKLPGPVQWSDPEAAAAVDILRREQRNTFDAQNSGNALAQIGRAGGNIAGAAPLMMAAGAPLAAAGEGIAAGVPALAPAVNFIRGATPFVRGAPVQNTAALASRAVLGAQQGATGNALVSSSSDQPLSQQMEMGAEIGGPLGAAAPIAVGAGKYVGRAARAITAPFTATGRNRLANQVIERYAGGPLAPNTAEIVPGSQPTMAEASGNANVANLQRTLRDTNQNPFVEREQAQAQARGNALSSIAGSPQDIDAAAASRSGTALPMKDTALSGASTANPAFVNRTIKGILASPAGKRDVVASALGDARRKLILPNPLNERISRALSPIKATLNAGGLSQARQDVFTEARRLLNSAQRGNTDEATLVKELGALAKGQKTVGPIDEALKSIKEGATKYETDAAQLYGIRQSITDALSPLARGTPADKRLAAHELQTVLDSLDNAIEKAAPGYKAYLDTYSQMSRPIDAMKFLQGLNLSDAQGNITLAKVQNALSNIRKLQRASGTNEAKSLTGDQVKILTAIRDDLLRKSNTGLGRSAGSNTVQNIASQNLLQTILPGKVGAFAGKLNPETIGAAIGGALMHTSPEATLVGAGVGGKVGNILKHIMADKNEAVRHRLEEIMLNPSLYRPVQPGALGQWGQKVARNPLYRAVKPLALPSASLGVNRLLVQAPARPALENAP